MPAPPATIVLRVALAAVPISTVIPAALVLFADASAPSWLAPDATHDLCGTCGRACSPRTYQPTALTSAHSKGRTQ